MWTTKRNYYGPRNHFRVLFMRVLPPSGFLKRDPVSIVTHTWSSWILASRSPPTWPNCRERTSSLKTDFSTINDGLHDAQDREVSVWWSDSKMNTIWSEIWYQPNIYIYVYTYYTYYMCIYMHIHTHTYTHIAACGIAFYVFNMLKTHVLLLITGMYIYICCIYIYTYIMLNALLRSRTAWQLFHPYQAGFNTFRASGV